MKNLKFKIGLALIILNFPIGYGGLAIGPVISVRTGKPVWLVAGLVCYVLSWIMLGLGILLAGPEGLKTAKNLWMKLFKRSKKGEE